MSSPAVVANAVVTRDVVRRFDARTVLDRVSFSLAPGERLAVHGPSGSGKTTLLRILAGLDAPDEGEVALAGAVASRAGRVVVAPERRGVALAFQGLALFPNLRALEQVRFVQPRSARPERARELLAMVGLAERATARPDELSGGERQRLALARALAQEPRLLLLDEPFADLDPDLRARLRRELRALLESTRVTTVLVTHAREDALALAQRLVILDAGRVVAQGALDELVARPGHSSVVRALGLGQIVPGTALGPDEIETTFGRARARLEGRSGEVRVLVRPEQARVLPEEELGGTEGEVVSVELEAPEARRLRHVAVVRRGEATLRARAAAPVPRPGARVRIALEGELEPVD